ncbi:hypothetical protein EV424DRAFT_1354276 [Suillus variegatus]|nr:hypothetical protein EV424DRAFT_1354276 [Suillus variegatus]
MLPRIRHALAHSFSLALPFVLHTPHPRCMDPKAHRDALAVPPSLTSTSVDRRLPNPAMPGEDSVNENSMGRPLGNNNLPETPFIPRHNEQRTPSLSMHGVNNYMNPQPAGTPYLGHGNLHTPFSSGSEPRSRSQSLAPGGGHDPDYNQFARPHQSHGAGTYPYQRGGLLFQDQTGDMQYSGPQAQVQSLQGEMQGLKGEIAQLKEEYESGKAAGNKKVTTRNISNDHPKLKMIIHPMFPDLCNISRSLGKSARARLLNTVKPLESGEAYKEVDMKKIWYPNWKGNVDDGVNAAFIQEVVDLVWDNEKRLREDPNSKSEIQDADYDRQLITDCTKAYFRNIHKQFLEHHDNDKARKATERKNQGLAAFTSSNTEAFEKESGHHGVLAMIDTDFVSDVLSYGSDTDLTEDTLKRRRDADVGKAFGRWLSFKKSKVNKGPGEEEAPAPKRRKVVEKKVVKSTFDLAPNKMHSEPPLSGKKTIPFRSMVSEKWLKKNPGTVLLDGGEWLCGFYGRLKEGDIHKDDARFLEELNEWHEKDESSSDEEDLPVAGPVHRQLVLAAKSKLRVWRTVLLMNAKFCCYYCILLAASQLLQICIKYL